MARIIGLIGLFLYTLVPGVFAVSYPKPDGYVNDFASIYSPAFVSSLNAQLKDLEAKTTIQFVVVSVKSLDGLTIEQYANDLFKSWEVGQIGKDNGLMLLISPADRKLRFEIGYGLEGQITDGAAGQIIRSVITPEFKNGNFETGTQAGVNRIFQVLNFNSALTPSPPPLKLPFSLDNFWVIAIIFVYLISYMARTREFLAGGVVGFVVGLLFFTLGAALVFALIGFVLDFILSRNYKINSSSGHPTDFWRSMGGFKSGGWGGGGGGGFSGGGGRSGGGGASGGW